MNTSILLIPIVWLGAAVQTASSSDGQLDQIRARGFDLRYQDASGKEYFFEEKQIPYSFKLSTNRRSRDVAVEFVLVPSGDVDLHGKGGQLVEVAVGEPFYISTTEISNREAAELVVGAPRSSERAFEIYQSWMKERLTFPNATQEDVEIIGQYVKDPNMPALTDGPGLAAMFIDGLAAANAVDVRLPTLGEWHLAMKGGKQSRFWWGDEWEDGHAVPAIGLKVDTPTEHLRGLQPVHSGQPNAFGIYNIIGNTQEAARPSSGEIAMLRDYDADNNGGGAGNNVVSPTFVTRTSTVMLGGGVTTKMPSGVLASPLELEGIIASQATAGWAAPMGGDLNFYVISGVRPVVPLRQDAASLSGAEERGEAGDENGAGEDGNGVGGGSVATFR